MYVCMAYVYMHISCAARIQQDLAHELKRESQLFEQVSSPPHYSCFLPALLTPLPPSLPRTACDVAGVEQNAASLLAKARGQSITESCSRPPAIQEKQDSGDNDNWGRRRDRQIDWEGADTAAFAPRAAVVQGEQNADGSRASATKQHTQTENRTAQW